MGPQICRRAFLGTAAAALAGGPGLFAQSPQSEGNAGERANLRLVDTHVHLWDLARLNLPWLKGAPATINRSFLPEDFQKAAAGLHVAKAVYMEVDVHPSQQADEAAFAVGLCRDDSNPIAGAVIGGYPHADGFSEYLAKFAAAKCVKGLRTILHAADRPRGLCLQPKFVDAMKRLGDAALTFDLCLRPDELLDGAKLAELAAGTTFVLDHCGNIGLRPATDPTFRVWADGLKAAAGRPNVVCKISGLIDKATGEWTAGQIAERVGLCLDAFGEDRVLFGGDWPVCLLGGSYRRWVETLAAAVAERSPEFRRKLFADNATRVYRL